MLGRLWNRLGGLILTTIALALVVLLVVMTVDAARDRNELSTGGSAKSSRDEDRAASLDDEDRFSDGSGPSVVVIEDLDDREVNEVYDDDETINLNDLDAADGDDVNVPEDNENASNDSEGVVVADDDPVDGQSLADSAAQDVRDVVGNVAGVQDEGSSDPEQSGVATLPVTGPAGIVSAVTAVVFGLAVGYWSSGRAQLSRAQNGH